MFLLHKSCFTVCPSNPRFYSKRVIFVYLNDYCVVVQVHGDCHHLYPLGTSCFALRYVLFLFLLLHVLKLAILGCWTLPILLSAQCTSRIPWLPVWDCVAEYLHGHFQSGLPVQFLSYPVAHCGVNEQVFLTLTYFVFLFRKKEKDEWNKTEGGTEVMMSLVLISNPGPLAPQPWVP